MQPYAATLDRDAASRFANLVLAGLHREYPHKLDHVLNGDECARPPRELHPAFFGCFDWHSAVHGHWLLARVLRQFPDLPEAGVIRAALGASLTSANIAVEIVYLSRPNASAFERTYGWAWLLKLTQELARSEDAELRGWSVKLSPLADVFVHRYLAYLPKADYPIRAGTHANTAFGLAFAHDYAVAVDHRDLRDLVWRTAMKLFSNDTEYPAHLEPSCADFFSPALIEAELMRRLLILDGFAKWFDRFLPSAKLSSPAPLFVPAQVSDRGDGQIVHLDGLNLSRAWCMRGIAGDLPPNHSARAALERLAEAHLAASLPHVCSGDYAGEHWLATFAVLALTGA